MGLITGLAGATGVVVVMALVELVKREWKTGPSWAWPLLALVFGVAANLIASRWTQTEAVEAAVIGLAVGLMAMGCYSGTKAMGR